MLLALRHLNSPQIAHFLNDEKPALVLEAARAINDVPINEAMPELAKLINVSKDNSNPLQRRILNANFRVGTPESAAALAAFAARNDAPDALRAEALNCWANGKSPAARQSRQPLPPAPAA